MPPVTSMHSRNSKILDRVYVSLTKDRRIFASNLEDSLKLVTQTCAESLDVTRVSVWEFDPDNGCLTCMALYDRATESFERGATLYERDIPRYFEALAGQRLIDADRAQTDPRTRELAEGYLIPLDIRSMLDATLRFEGRLRGVLCAESAGRDRSWTPDEKVFVSSLAELIDQVMILAHLREQESHYRSLFDHSADSIFIVSDGVFVHCNPAAESMYECSREELIGATPAAISPERQPDGRPSSDVAAGYFDKALLGEVQRFEWRHRTLSGREFDTEVTLSRVPRGKDWYVTGIVRDISARKQAELELEQSKSDLEHRALHDSLTGLPNRDSFHRDANLGIDADASQRVSHAVYLLDLNRFKEVNDTLGHDFGDEMLEVVADRLRYFCQQHGSRVYRLGGDEFVLLAEVDGEDAAVELAEEVLDAFKAPFSRRDIDLHLETSIGIALAPRDGNSSHSLLRCADVALYNAKRKAIPFSLFDRCFDHKDKRHLTLMSELVSAIEQNDLMLHYHPRVDLVKDSCCHCEALLRWRHPEHGLIPPEEFIASAELNNLIHQLTRWVLRTALAQVKAWLDKGLDMTVSVNVSARNLVDQRFAEDLKSMLDQHAVPARRLEIEITESALIVDPIRALESLETLRRFGVQIAVDDFGTGYSSLSYLKRLPVHVLKIDRSFVRDMLSDESDATIVRSIIELAHSFGLEAVAEGVENSAIIDALKAIECDQAQGFHFCRPLPAGEFETWLKTHCPG
jgi:diguanylate cyclase (GGDEF)-like protein/PAS domain S-box-containing protein